MQPTLIKHHTDTQTVHIYTDFQETECNNVLFTLTKEYLGCSGTHSIDHLTTCFVQVVESNVKFIQFSGNASDNQDAMSVTPHSGKSADRITSLVPTGSTASGLKCSHTVMIIKSKATVTTDERK